MTLLRPLVMQAGEGDAPLEYSALEWRTLYSVLWRNKGILQALPPGINALKVSQRAAGANFSVDVGSGAAIITGDDVSNQGSYIVRSTAVENLVVPSPPVSGSRTHRVVARVKDKLHNGSWTTYEWTLEVLEDPGSGVPAVPASAISLATVTVAAGQSSVTDSNISDTRATALLGPNRPNLVSSDAGRPPNPAAGEQVWRSDKGYIELYNGSGWVPWVVTPQAPVEASDTTTITTNSITYVTGSPVVSATFTAPPSGRVYVTVTSNCECEPPSSVLVSWQLHSGSSSAGAIVVVAQTPNAVIVQEDHSTQASNRRLVPALTPGQTYYIQVMFRTTSETATAFYRRILVEPAS